MATLNSLKANFKMAEGLLTEIASRVKDSVPGDELDKIRLANEELRKDVEKLTETLTMIEVLKGQEPTYYLSYKPPSNGLATSAKLNDEVKSAPQEVQKGAPQKENAAPAAPSKDANANTKTENVNKKAVEPKDAAAKPAKAKGGNPPQAAAAEVVDISRLDLRIGKIVEIDRHPEADTLYVEQIEVGEPRPRTVISGLVQNVPIEEMRNRMVVLLCNLKPAKMRGIVSEAMVMCACAPEKVEPIAPPAGAVPGDLVEFEGYTRNPDSVLNPKKKIFETVAPDLMTNAEKVATYKGVPFTVPGKGVVTAATLAGVKIK